MNKELKAKILSYNRMIKERSEKAGDMDILMAELLKLPQGQLKKLLTQEVLAVLRKYGYEGGE